MAARLQTEEGVNKVNFLGNRTIYFDAAWHMYAWDIYKNDGFKYSKI